MKPKRGAPGYLLSVTLLALGGCSTDSVSSIPDEGWELEEEDVLDIESEPEPEPAPEPEYSRASVRTDGSEPDDITFVFHPFAEAKKMPTWDDDPELRYDLNGRGRWIAQKIRDPNVRFESRDDIWLGTRLPNFHGPDLTENMHVFECIPKLTTFDYYYEVDGNVFFCQSTIISMVIRSSNARGSQWFDDISNIILQEAVDGTLADFLQEGTLPTWEGVWFQMGEDDLLHFKGMMSNNDSYAPYLSSDYPLVKLHIETVVE